MSEDRINRLGLPGASGPRMPMRNLRAASCLGFRVLGHKEIRSFRSHDCGPRTVRGFWVGLTPSWAVGGFALLFLLGLSGLGVYGACFSQGSGTSKMFLLHVGHLPPERTLGFLKQLLQNGPWAQRLKLVGAGSLSKDTMHRRRLQYLLNSAFC